MQVQLNEIGEAFLLLEDYYANGVEVVESPEQPESDFLDADAEEYYSWMAEQEGEAGRWWCGHQDANVLACCQDSQCCAHNGA